MDEEFYLNAKFESLVCGNDPETKPPWFDERKFKTGQRFYDKYFVAVYMSCLCGLLTAGTQSLLGTMKLTGNTDDKEKSFRRILRTLLHMNLWYTGEVWLPESEACRSLMKVRRIHEGVVLLQRKHLGTNSAIVPLSQFDMVLTQFAFIGFLIVYPKKLGAWYSVEEVDGLLHFWRTIGYILGIDDKYNLCSSSYSITVLKCKNLIEREFKPTLNRPPDDYELFTVSLIDGIGTFLPGIDYNTYLKFTYDMLQIPTKKKLNWRLCFKLMVTKFISRVLLVIPYFRRRCKRGLQRCIKYGEKRYNRCNGDELDHSECPPFRIKLLE